VLASEREQVVSWTCNKISGKDSHLWNILLTTPSNTHTTQVDYCQPVDTGQKLCLVPASRWFDVWLILRPWKRRRQVPPRSRLIFNGLHGVISQKTEFFITTAVRTSNTTTNSMLLWNRAVNYSVEKNPQLDLHSTQAEFSPSICWDFPNKPLFAFQISQCIQHILNTSTTFICSR
jgi:hypothetical protein